MCGNLLKSNKSAEVYSLVSFLDHVVFEEFWYKILTLHNSSVQVMMYLVYLYLEFSIGMSSIKNLIIFISAAALIISTSAQLGLLAFLEPWNNYFWN